MRADKFFALKFGSRTKAAEAIEKGSSRKVDVKALQKQVAQAVYSFFK